MDFSHLTAVAVTDIGRKRKSNEDAILSLPEAGIFCVADGMGGAAGGELASRWTVESIHRAFPSGAALAHKTSQVRQALNEASQRIKAMADSQSIIGAGTTVVVLFFDDFQPDQATILHAGDSRAYRIRDGILESMTLDHTLAAAAGLEHERFLPAMFRGVVTRAIGLDNKVELDESVIQVQEGDYFLLCSDGLSKMLADSEIQNLIHNTPGLDLNSLAASLVDEANRAGGDDNISVVLVRVGKLPPRVDRPVTIDSEPDIVDVTETAEAIVTADGSGATQAGAGANRPPTETGDVVGATPQSATATSLTGAKTAPLPAGGGPARAAPPPRSYFLVIVLAIIALALAYYLVRQYLARSAPSRDAPAPAVLSVDVYPASALQPSAGAAAGGIPGEVTGAENKAIWKSEWNRAARDPAAAAGALEAYRNAIATLCEQAGLKPPPGPMAWAPPTDAAPSAEEQATLYCRQLFDLQQHLRNQAAAAAAERAAELAVFGDQPLAAIENLRRFSEQPAGGAGYPFDSLKHNLQLAENWLAEDKQRMVPLDEIRTGPPSLLPRLLTQRNELWAAVLAEIEASGAAIAKRQAAESENALLNNIAALQQVIVKNAARQGAPAWPTRENLPTLKGFFERVGQYLNPPPAAAPETAPVNQE